MNTNKAIINSWNWQHQLGYAQAVEISHSTHTLYGGGQAAMNAEGRPVTADMGGQISAPEQTIAYFPSWRAKACYFYDAAGNLLEFIARTDLNLDNPNLTLMDMFQGVSEIGLVTQDVPYTAEQLQRRFNVEQFSKTIPQPDFNALGDDNGLFILAKAGRPWLFTNTPADLNYFRIQFTNGIDEEVQELYSYEVNRLPLGKPGFSLSQHVPGRMKDFAC